MSHEASAWGWSVPALPAWLRVVLLALAEHVGEEGASCFPGQGRLAAMCGISERQLRNLLRELERRGLIAIEHRPAQGGGRRSKVDRLAMSEGPPVSESPKATGTPTQGNRNASAGQAETGFRNCGSESPPATGTPASGNRNPIADETEEGKARGILTPLPPAKGGTRTREKSLRTVTATRARPANGDERHRPGGPG